MHNHEQLERRLEAARDLLVPQVHPSDTERALRRFKDLGRQRRRRVVVGGVFAMAAAAAIAALALRPIEQIEQPTYHAPEIADEEVIAPKRAEQKIVHFTDGSFAELLQEQTELRIDKTSPELLELTMVSGSARIDVVPNPNRLFRVSTRHMRIEVLGTAFTVYQDQEDESVTVNRGKVAVYAGKDRYELVQGMTYRYDEELNAKASPLTKKKHARNGKKGKSRAWRELAEDGQMAEAYEAMRAPEQSPDSTDVRELMLAADVARLTGHPKEAVEFLETAVDKNKSDANAVLAAFTLGGIFDRQLGEPKRCADAFKTARELAPKGSLAEDALAHEIECRTRAGESANAKALAKKYVEQYPEGRRIEAMRRISGNE